MNKQIRWITIGLVIFALLLAACAPPAAPAPEEPVVEEPASTEAVSVPEQPAAPAEPAGKTKVAFFGPGIVSDQSWNQFGFEGLKKAEADCGVEIAYSENVSQDAQLETLRNYAVEKYNIIIAHGGEYEDNVLKVAEEFPEIEFGVTSGSKPAKNVTPIKISYAQMGYLAGTLACEMTKSNHIAFVGAEEIAITEDALREYKRAAQECGKGEVQVDVVMTGSWADVNKAYEAARGLIASGADVLWHVLDTADAGLIAAAQDANVFAIGLYRDSSDLGPKAVIGSALGSPGTCVYLLACGKILTHEPQVLDVNIEDGVGIHLTDLTPPEVQEKVLAVLEKMKSGEIEVVP